MAFSLFNIGSDVPEALANRVKKALDPRQEQMAGVLEQIPGGTVFTLGLFQVAFWNVHKAEVPDHIARTFLNECVEEGTVSKPTRQKYQIVATEEAPKGEAPTQDENVKAAEEALSV